MSELILSAPLESERAERARRFCAQFCAPNKRPKFVLGRNVYVEGILGAVDVDGIIDDFAEVKEFQGRPVVKTAHIPGDALVLIASGGRPFTARHNLQQAGLECLDYFSFYKWSGLPLREAVFNEGFAEEFAANRAHYEWIYGKLADEQSREIFKKLVSFRLKYDIELLDGFKQMEDVQYFEPFLHLAVDGETFLDVGGFDGSTSRAFIARCPGYRAVHLFEPEPANYARCVANLAGFANVFCHRFGLSDAKRTLQLTQQGSASQISEQGTIAIEVERLDDVLAEPATYLKMDIEGAEAEALEGARASIMCDRPRLAISVYHKPGDFWRIPRQVLSMHDGYALRLRHYTESIYETVMYFLPS